VTSGGGEDEIILELYARALALTGYRADEPHARSIGRAVQAARARGVSLATLRERAKSGDPEIDDLLICAISVPETYFFRQPEHFHQIASFILPKLGERARIRAWSAGCATGEETYSLAACLLASAGRETAIEVLGTDLSAKNVAKAESGIFGPWSIRAPLLHPLLSPLAGGASHVVRADVRAVTRFATHSVLSPPPEEEAFDLVLCRNVLLYLSPEAVEAALVQLARALAPGGFILFGTLDLNRVPNDLAPVGPPEANMWRRARMASSGPRPPMVPLLESTARPSSELEAIAIHERALTLIESGDRRGAERVLERLLGSAPAYLPAILEYALLQQHAGREARAVELMGELLSGLEVLPEGARVAGPLELSVDYYRLAAEAFLTSNARKRSPKESLR
jgi:chemotaxis protein methyltransferase CheR